MAKVVIIDVDLGINIDTIIAESAKELTAEARHQLDNALAIAESAKRIKEEKTLKTKSHKDGIQKVLDSAYEMLESQLDVGVSVSKISDLIKDQIPNTSAFATRMNNILNMKGNPYRMLRKKVDGIPHYIFTKFNVE